MWSEIIVFILQLFHFIQTFQSLLIKIYTLRATWEVCDINPHNFFLWRGLRPQLMRNAVSSLEENISHNVCFGNLFYSIFFNEINCISEIKLTPQYLLNLPTALSLTFWLPLVSLFSLVGKRANEKRSSAKNVFLNQHK